MRASLLLVPFVAACTMDSATYTPDSGTKSGDGQVSVSPDPVVILDCSPGFSSSADLSLQNIGVGELTVTKISVIADPSDAWTFTDVDETVLAAGDTLSWPISATMPDETPVTGTLRIRSDDADAPSFDVALCAFATGYGGDTSCSS